MNNEETAISILKKALEEANKELAKDTERMRVMREALETFPKSAPPNVDGECVHGEDWALCDGCKYEWEVAVVAWKSKRDAALASTAPVAEAGQKEGE